MKKAYKIKQSLEVLRVYGARTRLQINYKKAKSLRLGISEEKEAMLGNENIDQVDSLTSLGSIISRYGECSKGVKSSMAKTQGIFSRLNKFDLLVIVVVVLTGLRIQTIFVWLGGINSGI